MWRESLNGLYLAVKQWGINKISDAVFKLKKAEAIRLARAYNCKYYVIQYGYFGWNVLRAGSVEYYKRTGKIARSVTAKELAEISAFIAMPKNLTVTNPKNKRR